MIGGASVLGGSGRRGPVYDPVTGAQAAEVDFADASEVDRAVAAAVAAFPRWHGTSLKRRTEILFAFGELLRRRGDEVARAITAEHGKVESDAAGEVARGLENVEYACGIPELLKGGYSHRVSTGVRVHEVREPLGVVAGISPFNFPAMVPLWMFPGAIACGNTFVLKPSEKDPSASVLLAQLWSEAGLPDGVFNVIHGDKVAVDSLLGHPDIQAVSFVGSTPVARYVYEHGTAAGKRVQALGGAKNHMVVLPDADLDMAADAAVSAAYGSAGERCMAISVLIPVGDIADALVEKVRDRIAGLRIGPGSDPDSQMGPLVTCEHRDKVAAHVGRARDEGAAVLVDGRDRQFGYGGFFLGPSLIDQVRPEMTLYREEVFGPVLAVVRARTFDEAIATVNANPYGNGAAIYTRDGGAAARFEDEANVGMVGVNVPIPVPVAYYSFGGWKASLFGDSHMYGPQGVHFYTRTKVVTTRWPDPATSAVDLGFPRNR